jgi:predicted DCC family thiol-disulfide oxidoreductase YuxK
MTNGWTGGQYSLYRILFGGCLVVHFARLSFMWDGPAVTTALGIVGALLALPFLVGWHDRPAALGLAALWIWLIGHEPLIPTPAVPWIAWLLLAHLFLPPAPYGSWAARGRPDPAAGWRMPRLIFAVTWVLMALGYAYDGYTKLINPTWIDGTGLTHLLESPLARPTRLRDLLLDSPDLLLRAVSWTALALELGFAPLALFRRVRPWLWLAVVLMQLSLILLVGFTGMTIGLLLLHLFAFDPGWIPPLPGDKRVMVYYDGTCGLCHRSVRFLLAEDRAGDTFRYAPLESESFRSSVPEARRRGLPDSVILMEQDGTLRSRSGGVLYAARRLGGLWRALATSAVPIPRPLRDWVYDRIAAVRYRLFARPAEPCPIIPPDLRNRFDVDR